MRDRIDKVLVGEGHFESRKKAQVAIERGLVTILTVAGQSLVKKASQIIDSKDIKGVRIEEHPELQYVSRSGYKLHAALEKFNIPVKGRSAIDIGLSTGGFSQCLLEQGARIVFGVDVGRDQLHSSLRDNSKLVWFDQINARSSLGEAFWVQKKQILGESSFDLMVIDVSFISVVPILEAQAGLIGSGSDIVALFKPQFEVGKGGLGKGGVVSAEQGLLVLEKKVKTIESLHYEVINRAPAAIEGEDGNQEYLLHLRYNNS